MTNTDSEVDHMLWERTSNASHITTSNGGSFVEANLLELIRDYTAYTVNPVFMGSDFLGNFPNFFEDIWTLDRGFLPLATGLPRWFPFPLLTRAHIAQKRILESITTFHEAMEKYWNGDNPGSKWSSLDDVGALIKARMPVYQKYKFSMRARAAAEHSLLWASNANSDLLVFWMVWLRILTPYDSALTLPGRSHLPRPRTPRDDPRRNRTLCQDNAAKFRSSNQRSSANGDT